MDFEDSILVQQTWYELIAVSQCTYQEGAASSQGGHYLSYRRRREEPWTLHSDMYTAEEAPILDDPANTTAVYRKRLPPCQGEDVSPGTRAGGAARPDDSPHLPPGEEGLHGGPPTTPSPGHDEVAYMAVSIRLSGAGAACHRPFIIVTYRPLGRYIGSFI